MKKYIWIIAIIAFIVVGIFIFRFNNYLAEEKQDKIVVGEQTQDYANLQTDEDIFSAIDESLTFLD